MEELQQLLDGAGDNPVLVIKGYRTSDGEVFNCRVKVVGHQGYRKMIMDSLEALVTGKVTPTGDPEIWRQAVMEQQASWERTLMGEQPQRAGSVMEPRGCYFLKDGVVVLRNLEYLEKEILVPAEKTTVSKEKTKLKAYIVENTPLKNYLGQLNLAPGKFQDITIE